MKKVWIILLALLVVASFSCRSDSGEEDPWQTTEQEPPPSEEATVVGMVLEPIEAVIIVDTSRQFAALATYSDGSTRDVTRDVAWEMATEGVAEVVEGDVRGLSPGSTTVTATYEGHAAQGRVTVPSAVPESISVRPTNLNVAVGETARLRADATLTDGTELDATELVEWSSAAPEVAVVSNDPPLQGEVRGTGDGATVVSARLGELEAQADVIVGATAQLAGIEIWPGYMRMVQGQRQPLVVLGRYSDGRIVDVSLLAEISGSDDTVISLDERSVIALMPGEARIDASLEGRVTSVTVAVTDADVVAIDVAPAAIETSVGGAHDFAATARLDDGTILPFDDAVSWRISEPAVAGIDAAGVAVGTNPGSTTVEARFQQVVGTAALSIFDEPIVGIDVEPRNPEVVVDSRWSFTAIGRYAGDRLANLSHSCAWRSSDPEVLSLTNSGRADALRLGVSVADCAWRGVIGASAVTVTPSDLTALEIEPVATIVRPGEWANLRVLGRHDDGRISDLTESAAWSSDATTAAVVSNATGSRGTIIGVNVGNAEIRAEFAGIATTGTVRVSDSALQSLRFEPEMLDLPIGADTQVAAIGRYEDGTEREVTAVAAWASATPTIATVAGGRVAGVSSGVVDITAVLEGVTGTLAVTVSNTLLERVEVKPADLTTARGRRTEMTATAVFANGTEFDVTNEAVWSSDDPEIAFVGNGVAHAELLAVDVGQTAVRALYDGVEGVTSVTVEGAALDSIVVSPAVVRAAVGVETQLVAIASYSDGTTANVTTRVSWTSDLPGMVFVNGTGMIDPLLPGTTYVRATFQGMSAAAEVTVTDASIIRLEIAPIEATLATGDQTWFQAVALFSDGTKLNVTRRAIWNSSDDGVARVESVAYLAGVTLAVAPGTAQIEAYYDGAQGVAEVTVTDATVESIQLFPTTYSLAVGTELFMTAQAIYSDGTSRNINWLGRWTSSDMDVADIRNAWPQPGLVTARSPGDTVITIEYQGVTATADIEVSDATLEAIQVFPFNSSITVGSPVWFQATGIFSDGRSVWLTRDVTWTTTDDSIAAISNGRWSEGRTIGVSPGQVTVEATWNGVTGSASLVVSDKSVTSIQVTPFLARIPSGYGELFQAVAIFNDNSSRNITQLSTWETSNPAVGSVGNVWWTNGIVLTHGAGQVDVLATWQEVTGQTSLTVTDAQVTSIDVTPAMDSVLPGAVIEFEALGHFDDGSTYDLTFWSTWLATDTTIANVSNAWGAHGEATAFSQGTTQITANKDGIVGTASLEVR